MFHNVMTTPATWLVFQQTRLDIPNPKNIYFLKVNPQSETSKFNALLHIYLASTFPILDTSRENWVGCVRHWFHCFHHVSSIFIRSSSQRKTCIHMHMYTYAYICIYMHIHTCIYIYSLVPGLGTAQTRIRLVKPVNSVTKFRRGIDKFH